MERAAIVDAADVGGDEAGADERDSHAGESEFGSDGVGESAHGEFAHGIGRRAGGSGPTGNAADENDIAVGLFDGGKSGVDGAEQAEYIGFELAAIIFESEFLEWADDTEAGIGDDDVEFAVGAESFVGGEGKVVTERHVGGYDEGSRFSGGGDFLGEGVEQFPSACGEGEAGVESGELEGEFFAYAGRSASDEDGLVLEEGVEGHGEMIIETVASG